MSKRVTIFGCGYLGRVLAGLCLEKGWLVSALTRNPKTAQTLRDEGLSQVVEARLEDVDWHARLDPFQDFVVNCVGAASRTLDGYRQSYVEGQESIGRWLSGGSVVAFHQQHFRISSIGRHFRDEKSSTEGASERGRLLLEAEEKCLAPSVGVDRSYVLRLAGSTARGDILWWKNLRPDRLSKAMGAEP